MCTCARPSEGLGGTALEDRQPTLAVAGVWFLGGGVTPSQEGAVLDICARV